MSFQNIAKENLLLQFFFKSEMWTVSDTFLNVCVCAGGGCSVKLEFLLPSLIIFPEYFTLIKLKKNFLHLLPYSVLISTL